MNEYIKIQIKTSRMVIQLFSIHEQSIQVKLQLKVI